MEQILVVEDTESLRDVLAKVLLAQGYEVETAASAEDAISILDKREFSLILSDLKLPGQSGLDLLRETKQRDRKVPFVVMTAYGTIDIAVEALKHGAADFITKPFDPSNLCTLLEQILEHRRIIDRGLGRIGNRFRKFLTQNRAVEEMLDQARKVAALSSPVLILGESGTGKELIARYIHEHSPRGTEQFVAVNCASMPSELLESEFFGHEQGAFTGATESRVGLFEIANDGTIFLDEIGTMPATLQTKLLRTLQELEVKPLGSTKIHKVNTRVVSATNCDIEAEIQAANFREDLFYRLSVVVLEIPPLRERPEDIPLLANYFIKSFSTEFERKAPKLDAEALKRLQDYHWPGNVRELENVIARALVLNEDDTLGQDALELDSPPENDPRAYSNMTLPDAVAGAVRRTEVDMISKVLNQTYGNKSKAAEILGVSYKTLLNKIKEYELNN